MNARLGIVRPGSVRTGWERLAALGAGSLREARRRPFRQRPASHCASRQACSGPAWDAWPGDTWQGSARQAWHGKPGPGDDCRGLSGQARFGSAGQRSARPVHSAARQARLGTSSLGAVRIRVSRLGWAGLASPGNVSRNAAWLGWDGPSGLFAGRLGTGMDDSVRQVLAVRAKVGCRGFALHIVGNLWQGSAGWSKARRVAAQFRISGRVRIGMAWRGRSEALAGRGNARLSWLGLSRLASGSACPGWAGLASVGSACRRRSRHGIGSAVRANLGAIRHSRGLLFWSRQAGHRPSGQRQPRPGSQGRSRFGRAVGAGRCCASIAPAILSWQGRLGRARTVAAACRLGMAALGSARIGRLGTGGESVQRPFGQCQARRSRQRVGWKRSVGQGSVGQAGRRLSLRHDFGQGKVGRSRQSVARTVRLGSEVTECCGRLVTSSQGGRLLRPERHGQAVNETGLARLTNAPARQGRRTVVRGVAAVL